MCRKIKIKIMLIVVILLAISVVYKDKTPDTYAKDKQTQKQESGKASKPYNVDNPGDPDSPDNPGGPDNPSNPGNQDNPDNPGDPDTPSNPEDPDNPGKPGDPDSPGKPGDPDNPGEQGDPDTPGEPEKPIQMYQLQCPEPDGKNGYYITKPEITITHISEYGVTKFRFTDPEGQLLEGELKDKDSQAVITKEQFKNGKNGLTIWMEDEEGKQTEGSEWIREFLIDTQAPDIQLSAPSGLDAWYKEGVKLEVSAIDGDNGSQVEKTACYIGDKCIGSSKNHQTSYYIQTASVNGNGVTAVITAEDYAGNQSKTAQKLYIDNTPPKAEIQGVENYMISSRPVQISYRIQDENVIGQAAVYTEWENVDGQKTEIPAGEWTKDNDGQIISQQLSEDGVYRLSVSANDKAGFEKSSRAQVIIDSHNPVIQYIDTLNNTYMREFCWDYPLNDVIQDYSSYVYEIRLDEKLYTMGKKVTEEGVHTLKVKAVDVAGNSAQAQARFTIDRTAPRIQFLNVEEDGTYEEHRTFKVTLADQKDTIDSIQINGSTQKINPRSKVYEYEADEYKDYLIEVKASDKAGNHIQSQIRFKVVEKETTIEKLIKPIKQRMNGKKTHEDKADDTVQEPERNYKWMAALAVIFVTAAGTIIYFLKRKHP